MAGKISLSRGGCILAALIVFFLVSSSEGAVKQVTKGDLEYVLPGATDFVRRVNPVPCYAGYVVPGGKLAGIAFLTTEVVPDQSWGYGSMIETLVGLDISGKITGVKVLSEFESPRYTKGLLRDGSWFLAQFEKMDANNNKFILQYDVDAISGATITSSTVNRSIRAGLKIITQEVLSREIVAESPPHAFFQHLLWQMDIILLWIITGLALYTFFKGDDFLRYLALGMGFAYIGIFKGGGFSLIDIMRVFSFRSPEFLNNLYWYSLLLIVVVVTIFAGRFYCGWLCPFGVFTELLYRIVPFRVTPSHTVDRCMKLIKFVILIVLMMLGLVFASPLFAMYLIGIVEPFATFFHLDGDMIPWVWLVLMLLMSSLISRCYCRYFCPLGAFFAVVVAISSFLGLRIIRVELPGDGCRESCQGCRIAEKQCQMGAVSYDETLKRPDIDGNECFMCNACAALCPVKKNKDMT